MGTKILIAEDDNVSRRLLHRLLYDWGYRVTEVGDGPAALKELQKPDAPKLAILDWMMPGLNGTEVVQHLRTTKPGSYTYVLLLTARAEKSDIPIGLGAGADDYLTKPFDERELQARLGVGERIIQLQERLECALAASEFRASHDALTGLYNRRMIVTLLDREVARCLREGSTMGAILADVDNFKSVNDTWGNGTGDQVLLETAGRMQSSLRGYDLLGRYAGEEFLIIAPNCGPAETQEVAERLRQAVDKVPIRIGDSNVKVSVSLGATVWGGEESPGTLLKRADLALHAAKQAGRNTVQFAPAPTLPAAGELVLPAPSLSSDAPGVRWEYAKNPI
jgi:diguanylate cyclase (GGDEF)-like protein